MGVCRSERFALWEAPSRTSARNRKLFASFLQNLAIPIAWIPQNQRFLAGFRAFHGRQARARVVMPIVSRARSMPKVRTNGFMRWLRAAKTGLAAERAFERAALARW